MVSPVEMTKLLGNAGLSLSTDILLIQGQLRYVSDWDREITTRLKSRAVPAYVPTVIRRHSRTGDPVEHRLVITEVPAGRARRFDYSGCRARASNLYHRHVTVVAAPSPLTLVFAKSGIWDGIKSEGWQSFAQGYATRRSVGERWNYDHQVSDLNEVRLTAAQLRIKEQLSRTALAELIMERDPALRPYTHNGAVLGVRRSSPTQRVDLDFAEQHPELRKFVTYSDRKAFTKVEFRPIGVMNQEGEGFEL